MSGAGFCARVRCNPRCRSAYVNAPSTNFGVHSSGGGFGRSDKSAIRPGSKASEFVGLDQGGVNGIVHAVLTVLQKKLCVAFDSIDFRLITTFLNLFIVQVRIFEVESRQLAVRANQFLGARCGFLTGEAGSHARRLRRKTNERQS